MKTLRKILIAGLCITLFLGCNNDDDNSQLSTLEGSWNLVNFTGTIAGFNIDYNLGDVTWTFNETSSEVTVVNNIVTTGPEDIYARYDTGTYNYSIVIEGQNEVLYINNENNGILLLQNSTFQLSDGNIMDGSITTFER